MAKLRQKAWRPPLIRDFLEMAETQQRWIVPHLVPFNGLIIVSGPRKLAMKTWTADFLSLVVAEGISESWVCGLIKGPVIYFEEEGTPRGTQERWRGFERSYGLDLKKSENLHYVFRGTVRLDEVSWVERIVSAVEEIKPVLVIFDAITYMHSKDENKTSEMRVVVDAIHAIRKSGTACMFLAHTNSEGSRNLDLDEDLGVRGSKVILDAYDTHIALRRASDKQSWIRAKVRQREGSQRLYKIEWDLQTEWNTETNIEEVMCCRPTITEIDDGLQVAVNSSSVLKALERPLSRSALREKLGCRKSVLEKIVSEMLVQKTIEEVPSVGRGTKLRKVNT